MIWLKNGTPKKEVAASGVEGGALNGAEVSQPQPEKKDPEVEKKEPPKVEPNPVPLIVRKTAGVMAGSATHRVEPAYPPMAKAAGVSGSVVVEVTIDEAGRVVAARAISGPLLLQEAAVAAARQWQFAPTLLSGQPVKVVGTLTFTFNL